MRVTRERGEIDRDVQARRTQSYVWSWGLIAVSLLTLVGQAHATEDGPEPTTFPDPPAQGKPWVAPKTTLPESLIDATTRLYSQGVPDPRDCPYHEVEIDHYRPTKAHAFVLPERAEVSGRYAIAWDGIMYPIRQVGKPADLDHDVKLLADQLAKTPKVQPDSGPFGSLRSLSHWQFPADPAEEPGMSNGLAGIPNRTPFKLVLLLRLGRADLAEQLLVADSHQRPEPGEQPQKPDEDPFAYQSLSCDWAYSVVRMMLDAHGTEMDRLALMFARCLVAFREHVPPVPDEPPMKPAPGFMGARPRVVRTLRFLNDREQLDAFVHDQERRIRELRSQSPIAGDAEDPLRIDGLIRELDQVRGIDSAGFGNPFMFPIPQMEKLTAEGLLAVEPLIKVLRSDDRLTRTFTFPMLGDFRFYQYAVYEVAWLALVDILETRQLSRVIDRPTGVRKSHEERQAMADAVEKYVNQYKAKNNPDRWYQTLRDDSASPSNWLEAATLIATSETLRGIVAIQRQDSLDFNGKLRGEALREGRDPSVSSLMLRRVRELAAGVELERDKRPDAHLRHQPADSFELACQLWLNLARWDEQVALQAAGEITKGCRGRIDFKRFPERSDSEARYLGALVGATELRGRLGEREALKEYADWLRDTPLALLYTGGNLSKWMQPLVDFPEDPNLADAVRWLTTAADSPWAGLLAEVRQEYVNRSWNPFASSLMSVPAFREGVIAALANQQFVGDLVRTPARASILQGGSERMVQQRDAAALEVSEMREGKSYPFRYCDLLMLRLSELEGCPPIALHWPEAKRDEAVAACIQYLKTYGDRAVAERSDDEMRRNPRRSLRLEFPLLEHPATPDDVTSGRAIFTLKGDGEAEVRRVSLGDLPRPARWLVLEGKPDSAETVESRARGNTNYDVSEGWVWQAEELREGDRWERYYGFVGHHTITRVPASELEFRPRPYKDFRLKNGLVAQLEIPSQTQNRIGQYNPGEPVPLKLKLQNLRGVAIACPTEYLRLAPDKSKPPALRQGVTLTWTYTPESKGRGPLFDLIVGPPGPAKSYEDAFTPDERESTRELEPLETFEAFDVDVNTLLDASKPGYYSINITFDDKSPLEEGKTLSASFQVTLDKERKDSDY